MGNSSITGIKIDTLSKTPDIYRNSPLNISGTASIICEIKANNIIENPFGNGTGYVNLQTYIPATSDAKLFQIAYDHGNNKFGQSMYRYEINSNTFSPWIQNGATGPQGLVGAQGPQGIQGPPGTPGSQGPAGLQGLQGPTGSQGLQGLQGPTGTRGLQGPTGSQGLQGPTGSQGPAGPQGPIGPQGPPGQGGQGGEGLFTQNVNEINLENNKMNLYSTNEYLSSSTNNYPVIKLKRTVTGLDDVYISTEGNYFKGPIKIGKQNIRSASTNFMSDGTLGNAYISSTGTISGKSLVISSSPDPNISTYNTTTQYGISSTGTVSGSSLCLGNICLNQSELTSLKNLLTSDDRYVLKTNVYDKTGSDARYALITNVYDKTGSDGRFASIINPSFTGTVSGINKSMVGLGNVDNTSDVNKPISTAMNNKFADYYNKNTIKSILNKTLPIGTIIAYSSTVVPSGFVLCNGAEYDRTGAFAKLFAIIGANYGTPSATTKFKVPDIKSRTIIGVNANKALASTGGTETVTVNSTGTLTVANMPAHNHIATVSGGGHEHAVPIRGSGGSGAIHPYFAYNTAANMGNVNTVGGGAHTHTVTIGDRGSGTAFSATANNVSIMQPYITLNYIIKYDDPSYLTEPTIVTENYIQSSYFGVF
jgi:hypothetical protein